MEKELTREQKFAMKEAQTKDKYKNHCTESAKFTASRKNVSDLKKLVQMTEQMNQLKENVEKLRKQIYDNMKSADCRRAILPYGKQVTISKSGINPSRKVFDEKAFKKDYPKLYEEYCMRTGRGFSSGERLTLKNITAKEESYYRQFPVMFETEKPAVDKQWAFGSIYSIRQFRDMVISGSITDYDGNGNYLGEDGILDNFINLSDIVNDSYPKGYRWVIWFNK